MRSRIEYCLIADDHAMMRSALAGTIRLIWPEARIETAESFPDVLAAASGGRFGLILCDLSMPGASPLDGVTQLLKAAPGVPLLVITGSEDDDVLLKLFDIGVAGYLHKSASGEVVEAAILLVAAGGRYLPPRILDLTRQRDAPAASRPAVSLTARQREVLALLVEGASNKEIARELAVSPATVKVHVAALLGALDARNRSQLVNRAHNEGWVTA